MKKLISEKFVLDEELNDVVGGDVRSNPGVLVSSEHSQSDTFNPNADFNRPIPIQTLMMTGC